MKKSRLLLVMLFCLPHLLGAQTRDPKKWPFAKTSIWNMPLHKNAVYVPANIQDAANFEADEDVIILTPDAPSIPVMTNTAGWSGNDRCPPTGPQLFAAPMPANWIFDKNVWYGKTPNAGAAILLPNGKIRQTQPFAKCGTDVATSEFVWSEQGCELTGECIAGAHGGSGLSAIGGTIRVGEFTAGAINHVLKINLWGKENFFGGSGGFRWPANKADGGYNDPGAHNYYGGTNPEMRIGALLALHKDLNLATLNGNSLGLETEAALIIAKALQNYGAYTVDNTAWDSYAFVIENGPDGIVRNEFKQQFGFDMNVFGSLDNSPWARDLKRIFKALQVISNNSASNIGGGPASDTVNRRAPMAPDFAVNVPARTIRIMPLGDSKIEGGGGGNTQNSWRGYLRTKLVRAGFQIDYVGDRQNTAAGDTIPPDFDHSGHGGYTIGPDIARFCGTCETTGTYEHVERWLTAANPDVVLLSIGVNDFFNGTTHAPDYPATAPQRFRNLVHRILELRPGVRIVVGTVEPVRYDVNWGGNPNDNHLGALNAAIKALADSSATDNIYFADIRNKMLVNYSAADFFDDVHLSAQGARKAADEWFAAVVPVLSSLPNNVAPMVKITAPAGSAVFTAPAAITLSADASDPDGSIRSVAFYNGSIKIGEDSTAPYSITWQNVDEGSYKVTARATDNVFGTASSDPVIVNVSSSDGMIRFAGTGIGSAGSFNNNGLTFSKAMDDDITTYYDGAAADRQWVGLDLGAAKIIRKMRYVPRTDWAARMIGGKLQGANAADFSDAVDLATIALAPLEGVYSTARVANPALYQYYRYLSPNGGYGNVAEVEFWGDPNDPVNQAPTSSLTSPLPNAVYTAGANISLQATAADSDGTITRVDFYRGNVLIGSAVQAPFNFVWANAPEGNHAITARAVDNAGVTKTSAAVNIKVNSAAVGAALYAENFDSNTATGWVVNSGTWGASSGKFRGTNTNGEFTCYYNGSTFSNYTFTLDATAVWGNDIGILFNYQNTSNYHILMMNQDKRTISIRKRVNGTTTTIVSGTFTGPGFNANHNISIKNTGTATTVRVNNNLVFDNVATPEFSGGRIGLYSFWCPTIFDNMVVVSNSPLPTVNISTPNYHSIFTAPASIPVSVAVTDADGTLSKVEYYNGTKLLATSTVAPFNLTLENPETGNYHLIAKAIHRTGYEITSSLVNLDVNPANGNAPAVQITAPVVGQEFSSPATISLTATANAANGSIRRVDFYNGAQLIGTAATSPYTVNWSNVKSGNYQVLAKAIDENGLVSNSATVAVKVVHPNPIVQVTAPAQNDSIIGLDVPITAVATAPDGTITKVEFYNNTTLLGTATASPYRFNFKAPSGVYRIKAKAIDNVGASAFSEEVVVTVAGYNPDAVNLLKRNTGFEAVAAINYANGAFTGITGWHLFNYGYNSIGVSGGGAAEGTRKLQIVNGGYAETVAADRADITAGDTYALTFSLRKSANRDAAVNSPATATIRWFDNAGVLISSSSSGALLGGPVTDWNTFTLVAVAPPKAVKAAARIEVALGTYPNDGKADFQADHFVLRKIGNAQPPVVQLTGPAKDTLVNGPASLTLQATAAANVGTLTRVEFYHGETLLGSDATSPYTFSWNNIAPGVYHVTAKAIDNYDFATISQPVTIRVNARPVVRFTTPENTSRFKSGSTVAVTAAAADTDDAISKVEFYANGVLVNTLQQAPYTANITGLAAGPHTISVKAFDESGTSDSTSVSVSINAMPVVEITSPADQAVVAMPEDRTIHAQANDPDGSISTVEFYLNNNLVATDESSPYAFDWTSDQQVTGWYTFTVKAIDSDGDVVTSKEVKVYVNALPTVSITAPAATGRLNDQQTVVITASALDADGQISKVAFYDGTTLLGTASAAPFTFNWVRPAAGTHSLTAKAYDNNGAFALSAPVVVQVNATPVVRITSPVAGSVVQVPENITLSAAATDADGTIQRVQFYVDEVLIGTSYTRPYSVVWEKVKKEFVGVHSIHARAFDNRGDSTVSEPVQFRIYHPSENAGSTVALATNPALELGGTATPSLKAYPNPFQTGVMTLQVTGLLKHSAADLVITTLTGEVIMTRRLSLDANGGAVITLPREQLKASGLYLVTIRNQKAVITTKITVL